MVFCSGCGRHFKPSGYTLHIRRSHASACSAAHREDLQAVGSNNNLSDDIEDAIDFQGDFFGNYEDGDFPWPVESDSDDDSEDDSYMDIDMGGHQGGWQDQETMSDVCPGDDDIFIEHFPSSSAGAAISNDQGFIDTDYNCYQRQCGNAYESTPFASQIHWDIARWAKVQGITSTAVTELLGINGVGIYATHHASISPIYTAS
jgi:hypothetical protein